MAVGYLTLFGGTGPTGIEIAKLLLQRDHKVTLFVRTPSKVPAEITSHPNVKLIQGNVELYSDVLSSITSETTGVISVLGPSTTPPKGPSPILTATSNIIQALKATHPSSTPRLVLGSTVSYDAPEDDLEFSYFSPTAVLAALLVLVVKVLVPHGYQDMVGICRIAREQGEGVDWTVVRVAVLTNGAGTGPKAGKKNEVGLTLARADYAAFMVDQVEITTGSPWSHRYPAISSS